MWSDAEREAFVDFVARHPLAGDVIPGTGGVRKVRWGTSGSGKRGGARVIYYCYDATAPLFLLSVHDKRQRVDLVPAERRAAAAIAALIKAEYQSRRSRRRP